MLLGRLSLQPRLHNVKWSHWRNGDQTKLATTEATYWSRRSSLSPLQRRRALRSMGPLGVPSEASEDPRTRTRRGRPAENYLISRCDASHGYKENNLKHFILLDTMASLSGQALQASRAALNAALADNKDDVDSPLEPGEIQEVDMQAQAEGLRTVFSDPKNFNVKVWPPRRLRTRGVHNGTAPTLFPVDSLV